MGNVACTVNGGTVSMSLNTCVSAGVLPCSTQSSSIVMKSTYAGTKGVRHRIPADVAVVEDADGYVEAQELVHHAFPIVCSILSK